MNPGDGFEKFEVTDWDLDNEFNTQRFHKRTSKKKATYGVFASDSESDDDEQGRKSKKVKDVKFVSSSMKADDVQAAGPSKPKTQPKQSFQSNRFAGVTPDAKVGQWEKHTKGIGSKLLEKMGWTPGKGLGKNLEGIAVPIEATLRAKGAGIGAAGKEKKQTAIFPKDLEKKEESGSSRGESKPKKRYVYKSVDELLDDDDESDVICLNTKVIDMRGPESKVVTGYKEMFTTSKTMPSGPAAEVEASIMALEKDLIKVTRDIKRNRDRIERIEDDKLFIDVETRKESEELDKLLEVGRLVNKLRINEYGDPFSSLTSSLQIYDHLTKEYPRDVDKLKFRSLIQTLLTPLVEKCLEEWTLLRKDQETFIDSIRELKETLSSHDSKLYQTLLWKAWMPVFRRSILNMDHHSVKNPDTLISSLEVWKPLLPKWLMLNVIHQLILPKITQEVEDWDPLTDVIPIHTWIHPWLPLIDGKHFEPIYRTILRKFARAISSWDPSDASAKIILSPWRHTIPTPAWNSFMSTHITPKLEASIQSMVITPGNQRLDHWTWLMNWQGMIPDAVIAGILNKHFFPNWIRTLYDWLSSPSVDFAEVSNWYTGWKNIIPVEIARDSGIQDFLTRGLEMMDFAVSSPFGMSSYVYRPAPPTPTSNINPVMRDRILSSVSAPGQDSISFKEIIERKAQEFGILFMPVSSKTLDGKQIYALGNHHIYLDRSVIFALNPVLNQWTPVSLDSLFQV